MDNPEKLATQGTQDEHCLFRKLASVMVAQRGRMPMTCDMSVIFTGYSVSSIAKLNSTIKLKCC